MRTWMKNSTDKNVWILRFIKLLWLSEDRILMSEECKLAFKEYSSIAILFIQYNSASSQLKTLNTQLQWCWTPASGLGDGPQWLNSQ